MCVVSPQQMTECVRATFWTRRWTRKSKDECKNVFIIFLRWLYSCIRHEKYFKFVSRHKLLKLQFNSQVHSLYLFFFFSTFFEWSPFSKKFLKVPIFWMYNCLWRANHECSFWNGISMSGVLYMKKDGNKIWSNLHF